MAGGQRRLEKEKLLGRGGGKVTSPKAESAEGICQQLLQLFICTKNIAKCQMCVYIDQIYTRAHTQAHTHTHVCIERTTKKIALVNPKENKHKNTT